ncbi:MAG: desulfoferrodoxin family protein [Reichenbachiella sp.]
MNSRRNFLKGSLAATAGLIATAALPASAFEMQKTAGFTYSSNTPGKWKGKEAGHAPKISISGNKVTISTDHVMSEGHYIVKHTLLDVNGVVLGEQTYYPSHKKAEATFTITGKHSRLYATSFCNLHDLWVTEHRA